MKHKCYVNLLPTHYSDASGKNMVILYRLLLVYIKDSLLHLSFVVQVAWNV